MSLRDAAKLLFPLAVLAMVAGWAPSAWAQRVYLNPSDQTGNVVSGGGNEAEYALVVANLARPILESVGFTVQVDQDFTNAPSNANSWGADVFVSIHSNAGGGHGTETLYVSDGGKVLAGNVQTGLLSELPYPDRGLKYRDNLHVLNNTSMIACLLESVFHDCTTTSGIQGHPPSESDFLRSPDGQQRIAWGTAAGVCAHFSKSCEPEPPAQTGWLKGVVYLAPNLDDRLPGALVQIEGGPSVTVGPEGEFAFELDAGTYTATATLDGYLPGSATQDVVVGEDVWSSIGLTIEDVPEPVAEAGPPEAGVDAPVQDAGSEPDGASEKAAAWTSEPASGCACSVPRPSRSEHPWGLAALGVLTLTMRRRRSRTLLPLDRARRLGGYIEHQARDPR